jgi:hypothetical protein
MILNYLTLLVALAISTVAGYYSIVGLTAIFAGAFWPVVIMGGVLELGKLMTTVWLRKNWKITSLWLRTYLTLSVVVLMLITSMGIFGYLSKAHLDQNVPTGDVAAQVALLDEKIKTERDNVDAAKRALTQMDAQVDQMLGRTDSDKGAERAVQIRRNQSKERAALQREIGDAQTKIAKLNEERAPVASQLRKVEAEVGPIKYIAALIYGDNPDDNLLERAVRWMIILLVAVFDPLAISLVVAVNHSLEYERRRKQEESESTDEDSEPQKKSTDLTKPEVTLAQTPEQMTLFPNQSNLSLTSVNQRLSTLTEWLKSPVQNVLSKWKEKSSEKSQDPSALSKFKYQAQSALLKLRLLVLKR